MYTRIAHIAIVVEDYDKAIKYYTERLDFQLLEDTKLCESKRWVLVAPSGAQECSILLAKAADKKQSEIIGAQTGGRVSFFLFTDDFERDYQKFKKRGVVFVRPPKEEVYGTIAVFKDLYGNLWDLLEPSPDNKGLFGKGDIKSKKPMQPKSVNFGTLLESVEDWIRNGLSGNRIVAKIVNASKSIEAIIDGAYFVENDNRIYLVIRRRGQEDLYDDAGNLLND